MGAMDRTGDFARLRDLFDRVAQLDPQLREPLIREACGADADLERELRDLLAAHDRESGNTGARHARMLGDGREVLASAAEPGDRVGSFVLREVLGRGGMGVVYRAERIDGAVQQQVAVKVLQRMHLDEAGVRRFAQERDIVAQLAHPNIARLFDAGTTRDGSPYYAMELVDGQPITTWCEGRKLALAGRLELFLKVCDAVRFAHANLVLHRDIKPGNVLVDASGEPKLIDFGIAKTMTATDATQTGQQMFSPSNAAPEQLRGERCGVACDVYQLGTLLYELLVGRTVLRDTDTTPAAIEASILHRMPARPSELVAQNGDAATAKSLRGDLDTIVLRALRKEPEQRYASVEQLGDEIRRHLRNEPITARGGERMYRFRKFLRRRAPALAAASVILLLVAAVIVVQLVQSSRLEQQRDEAEAARNRAQAVSGLLADVFTSADPGRSLDRNASIGTVLDRGRAQVEDKLRDEPALRVTMLGVLASVYSNIEDLETATRLIDEGMAIVESPMLDDRSKAEFLERAAHVRVAASEIRGAEAAARAAVAAHERLGDPPSRQWEARESLAGARMALRDRSTWRREVLDLLRYMESDPNIDPLLLARVRVYVGNHLNFVGVTPDSVRMLRESLDTLARMRPPNDDDVLDARYALGLALTRSGNAAEGIVLLQDVADAFVPLYGEGSSRVARTMVRIAEAQIELGRFADAEATGKRSLAAVERGRKWPHSDIQVVNTLLGEIYALTGDWPQSEKHFREAVRTAEAIAGTGGANIVEVRRGLAVALLNLDRLDEAVEVLERARPLVDFSTAEHAEWALAYAEVLHRLDRDREATELLDRVQPFVDSTSASDGDLSERTRQSRAAALRQELVD